MDYDYAFTLKFMEVPIAETLGGRRVSETVLTLRDSSRAFEVMVKACEFYRNSWNLNKEFIIATEYLGQQCATVTSILKIPNAIETIEEPNCNNEDNIVPVLNRFGDVSAGPGCMEDLLMCVATYLGHEDCKLDTENKSFNDEYVEVCATCGNVSIRYAGDEANRYQGVRFCPMCGRRLGDY